MQAIRAKLQSAMNLCYAEEPSYKVIAAEIGDALSMLNETHKAVKEVFTEMDIFPIKCVCEAKGTKAEHKSTTVGVAAQIYNNYARYNGRAKTLFEIGNEGGFDCVDARLYLAGSNPAKADKESVAVKHYLAANPDIVA